MMRDLKKESRKTLKKGYWKLVAICFIVTLVSGGTIINIFHGVDNNFFRSNYDIANDFMVSSALQNSVSKYLNKATKGVLATFANNINKSGSFLFGILNAFNQMVFKNKLGPSIVILIGVLFSFLYWYLVSNVIKVGKARFLLENRRYKQTKMQRLLFAYRDKKFKNVAVTMFKKKLYTFFWSFTVIGGFIKHYSYFFVPYILAENPLLESSKVLKLSGKMARGYKWQMFLLDLSFIGYYIVGILSLNIFNLLFTNPYREVAYTEFYMKRRNKYISAKESDYNFLILEYLNVDCCEDEYPNAKTNDKKIKSKKITYTFWDIVLLFFAFSIIGYVWEVLLHLFSDGTFVNRGTLYGPWLTIYGFGGISTFLFFYKYRDNPVKVFFLSMLLCGVIEYFSSWYMEVLYKTRWWDYTGYFLNINGRICLEGLLIFGFGCCVSIYFLTPFLIKNFHDMNKKILLLITIILIVLFTIDLAFYLIKPNQGEGISLPNNNGKHFSVNDCFATYIIQKDTKNR